MMVEGELLQLSASAASTFPRPITWSWSIAKRRACSRPARGWERWWPAPIPAPRTAGDYAWNLGMAFQLIDDRLDFTAESRPR